MSKASDKPVLASPEALSPRSVTPKHLRLVELLEVRVDAHKDATSDQVKTTGQSLDNEMDKVVWCWTGS